MIARAAGGADLFLQRPAAEELREQYLAYRTRQALALVSMLPRDVVRPLYRRAVREEVSDGERPSDPLALLLRYCEAMLPLPPFEVWNEDLRLHPEAHLRDMSESAHAPTAMAPATLDARSFARKGERWIAHLRSFRERDAWRGHIEFEEPRTGHFYRTAAIFREGTPAELRERFRTFESESLEAFLRSALP